MSVIECHNLTKAYGRFKILDNMSFTIEDNKITGLIGKNGAGKTTLLKIIAGFFRATSGEAKVFSKMPFNNLEVSANTVFIDNQMALPTSLRLTEILDVAGQFYPKWDAGLAKRLFDYFSFNPYQHHDHLSKGSKSTFNMIFGLCTRSPLTIFDEPTTGMDAAVRKDFYRALLKDYIAHPRTIIISSHHLDEIEDLLENVLIMRDGKTYLHIPISDLKEWAIELTGKKSSVNRWVEGKDMLHTEAIGENTLQVVVKNDFSKADLKNMKLSGVETASVSSSDAAVYMTNKHRGGIDDVFR